MYHLLLICLVFPVSDILGNSGSQEEVGSNGSSGELPGEPCSVESSFLFTREDVVAGSALMKLPTSHGEKWTLIEAEPTGYLLIEKLRPSDSHAWIIFSKSPDLETISKSLGGNRESLPFLLVCTFHGWSYKYKQELIISDVNEHPPVFDHTRVYSINVSESTSVGSSVFSLRQIATDPDTTGRVSAYSLEPYLGPQLDGRQYFKISDDGNHVILSQPIDYDVLSAQGHSTMKLNLTATDNGVPFFLSSHIVMTVAVTDTDDQGPAFVYPDCQKIDNFCILPYFQTAIKCEFKGLLRLYPGPVLAVDRDSQNHSMIYSISRVDPEKFLDKLTINKWTGEMNVISSFCSSGVNEFIITVTATEVSDLQHGASANIQVKILDNLMFPNIGWNLQVANDQVSSSGSSLPLTFFLVAVIGFVVVGAALAFVAVRITQNRKNNRVSSAITAPAVYSEDCHVFQNDLSKAVTCFQTCPVNCNPQLTYSNTHGEQTIMANFPNRTLEAVPFPSLEELESQEMWTAFRNSNTNPFISDNSVHFSPSFSLPGHSDTSRFYDANSSFGSMKHESRGQSTEGLRDAGKFRLRLTSVVPGFFKAAGQRVRFDTSNLNQSCV